MIDSALRVFPDLEIPVIDGEFKLVYEPDPAAPNTWMLNDHCLIQDEAGRIHCFAIENPFPPTADALEFLKEKMQDTAQPFLRLMHSMIHGGIYMMGTHFRVGHAVADNIWGPWERLPAAHDGRAEKCGHGSPFVVRHDGQYWMFEPTKGSGIFTSPDLMEWTAVKDATAWHGPEIAVRSGHRDPCIIRLEDGTFLQYFAGADSEGRHSIRLAVSRDLKAWRSVEPCYVDTFFPECDDSFGIFESPFVHRRGRLFYLFVGFSHRHYYESFVVVSDNPYRFSAEHKITTVFSHAPELIDIDGRTYMSSCGIEDPQMLNRSGLWMSALTWLRQ